MRIAFYAPMKAPDHPVPSGDRAMARALLAALAAGGHTVSVASMLRAWCAMPDPGAMHDIEAEADREVERLSAAFASGGPPDLWFTYHSYYRAPDLIGPRVSAQFDLPYVVAEVSQAGKRAVGPWISWHDANERAIRAAAIHICFTDRDAGGLAQLVGRERIAMLPPFLATGGFGAVPRSEPRSGPVRLVTAAMMRPSKIRSFVILAEALAALPRGIDWRLGIAGDGPERPAVEAAFGILPPDRIVWHGALDAGDLAGLFAESDLFAWPGFGEPFGVTYLEAAAAGLPVVAMDSGGVASVVTHGRSGLLVPEGNVTAYRAALERMAADADLRTRFGQEGKRIVLEDRTVARAAAILNGALDQARKEVA